MKTALMLLTCVLIAALCGGAACCEEFCLADCVACSATECDEQDLECVQTRLANCESACASECAGGGPYLGWIWGGCGIFD
jgi:hypothetical protein